MTAALDPQATRPELTGDGGAGPSRGFFKSRYGSTSLRVGVATTWLSVIVLLPLAAIVWQSAGGGWAAFWSLTLPLLRPIIAVTLILRTTFAFMVFDEILAITQGGPGNDTWVAAWYTYRMSFQPPFNIGLGAASAWGLTLIIGAFALLYVRFVYRRVEW